MNEIQSTAGTLRRDLFFLRTALAYRKSGYRADALHAALFSIHAEPNEKEPRSLFFSWLLAGVLQADDAWYQKQGEQTKVVMHERRAANALFQEGERGPLSNVATLLLQSNKLALALIEWQNIEAIGPVADAVGELITSMTLRSDYFMPLQGSAGRLMRFAIERSLSQCEFLNLVGDRLVEAPKKEYFLVSKSEKRSRTEQERLVQLGDALRGVDLLSRSSDANKHYLQNWLASLPVIEVEDEWGLHLIGR
jgi:hypothetical protein